MTMFAQPVIEVAVAVPLRRTFDYWLPDGVDANETLIGKRVLVPFGRQSLVGVIVGFKENASQVSDKMKAAISIIDSDDLFSIDDEMMSLLNWAAGYYQHPIGDVLNVALPGALRSDKSIPDFVPQVLKKTSEFPELEAIPSNAKQMQKLGLLLDESSLSKEQLKDAAISSVTIKKFVDRNWAEWQPDTRAPAQVTEQDINESLNLNADQSIAVAAINSASQHQAFLLDGVTGSGKTEVYLQAIEHRLKQQQQVLVCVPEIGLTPQTIARFKQRFNVEIAVWHSGMTDRQRMQTWLASRNGLAKIIIATRSGVFLPFQSLGMIIVDEEHDSSFKQQDGFKYHCRSLALYRANKLKIPVVLGSATPSLETLNNANSGKFSHLKLTQRAGNATLPTKHLLDLNRCQTNGPLGLPLLDAIKEQLNLNRQVMLFINRRGFAPVLMCEECHWLTECSRCSSFTTFHKTKNALICHHCGFHHPTLRQCLSCGSTRLTPVGIGTEQIEHLLQAQFPEVPVVRIDRDNTSKKGAFDEQLEIINQGQPMIIVGTQMIAKGHHFPNVSLVGIVDVDGALFSSDFRSAEKLSQLVVQVAGRAGRASIKGQVWLQTKFPEHPVIQDLVNNEYEDFAKYALNERQMLRLPPFSHQATLRAESTLNDIGEHWLVAISEHLAQQDGIMLLGPMPAPMTKKAGKYRHILILQSQSRPYLQKLLNWLIENLDSIKKDNRIRWSIDVDPIDLS